MCYECRDVPDKISNDEIICRVLFSPFHFKKDKLQTSAFKAKSNESVSCIRFLYEAPEEKCKKKALELEDFRNAKLNGGDPAIYKGFAIIKAINLTELEQVINENQKLSITLKSEKMPDFCSHAGFYYNIPLVNDEAAPSHLNSFIKKIISRAHIILDNNRLATDWTLARFNELV